MGHSQKQLPQFYVKKMKNLWLKIFLFNVLLAFPLMGATNHRSTEVFERIKNMEYENKMAMIENMKEDALSYLGTPYRWGAVGPNKFDCSGFTQFIYNNAGIELLRTSKMQYTQGTIVNKEELMHGDLVFFGSRRNKRIVGHVGIVLAVDTVNNEFTFIHAANNGVEEQTSEHPYYKKRYIGARRIII